MQKSFDCITTNNKMNLNFNIAKYTGVIIWKDIGGGWQRFHSMKCRVGCFVENVWVWIGEGTVSFHKMP
jgi:hypothetical protein